jgi:hypothetical protein
MKCPECKAKQRGRPQEFELPELLDHMFSRHPLTVLTVAHDLLKSNANDLTDVTFIPEAKDGA